MLNSKCHVSSDGPLFSSQGSFTFLHSFSIFPLSHFLLPSASLSAIFTQKPLLPGRILSLSHATLFPLLLLFPLFLYFLFKSDFHWMSTEVFVVLDIVDVFSQ